MQQHFCLLFLALIVAARAQFVYNLCDPAACQSTTACTCARTTSSTTCQCAEDACNKACLAISPNCVGCTLKTDTTANTSTCVPPSTNSACSSPATCSIDSAGKCGGIAPPTCETYPTRLTCGAAPNGATGCAWSPCPPCLDLTPTVPTCGGIAKPSAQTASCLNVEYSCPQVGCANGWTSVCATTDPCQNKCTGTATCPPGQDLDPNFAAACKLNTTSNQCAWYPVCRSTQPRCLTSTGTCGELAKPTTCITQGQVVPAGATYSPVCDTLYFSTTTNTGTTGTTSYTCKWRDNCVPLCSAENKTCGGVPLPDRCPYGSYSTTGTVPTYTCRGLTTDSCAWYPDNTCVYGCQFNWAADAPAPTCAGNPFPCPNVPVEIPTTTFSNTATGVALDPTTSTTVVVSASRLSTLCYPNADQKCVFPPITCPTAKCYPQLRSDGSEVCGGNKKDFTKATCTDAQYPVAKCTESTSSASGCDWSYSCVTKVVSCLKDTTLRTCNGVRVEDTCATQSGTYFADFTCTTDNTGNCVSSALCKDTEVCYTGDLSKCLVNGVAEPTCTTGSETAASTLKCCCRGGQCYFSGLECNPVDPCTTCVGTDATVRCPDGQKVLALPTCVKSSTGACSFTPIKCGPIPVTTCTSCPVAKPCDVGSVVKSVKCDPSTCQGIPECVADSCYGVDPCKCDSAKGCVWIVGPTTNSGVSRSFCASKESIVSTTQSIGTIHAGSEYCKPGANPTPNDHVIDAVTTNAYTGNNVQTAISNFIADLKALETKVCPSGELCGLKFAVSFFAVGVPTKDSITKSLTLYVTVLFTPLGVDQTPSLEVKELYCTPIKKLLGTLSGAFDFNVDKDRLGGCSFTASQKRDVQQSSNTYNAGISVPVDVYGKYISASPSLISGCLMVISALVALFLF